MKELHDALLEIAEFILDLAVTRSASDTHTKLQHEVGFA